MDRRGLFKKIAFLCVILVLVLVMVYSGLRILESTVFQSGSGTADETGSKTLIRDGIAYFPRQDITVIMLLGIDKFGEVEESGSYNNPATADMISLLIFDESAETCNVLCLNRDTILEMPVLGIGGKEAGTIRQQLALAHTYGSGLEDSCENVRKTVSKFLYDIPIDYYVAMRMNAVSILNDAVGGVTVTVVDDFSAVDPTITMGQMTLRGEQAIHFVQTRKGVDDQTNLSRMKRQEAYMDGFVKAFQECQSESTEFFVNTYDSVAPYIVSDCSVNALSGMMSRYAQYEVQEVISPKGENVRGEKHFEFYVDEADLDALILKLLYAPKN